MATFCGISTGIGFDCNDIPSGGLKSTVYLGNVDDIDRTQGNQGFAYDANGNIYNIFFSNYAGLYEFTGSKNSHSTSDDIVRTEGGNPSFLHTVVMRLFDTTAEDRDALLALSKADVFAIVQTSDGRFEIFGKDLGLNITSAVRDSGTTPEADKRRVVTITGSEPAPPQVFLDTNYATTLNKLQAYVV